MARFMKKKTKTDLDHALRRCIDKREDMQEYLQDHSATFSIEGIKSDLDDLNEIWECVVTANWSFVDYRVYYVESDALELEIFDTKYEEERRKVFTITGQLEEKTRLQQAANSHQVLTVAASIPASPSCSFSHDPSSLIQPPSLSNGSAVSGMPGLLQPTDESLADSQLQQLTAADSQVAATSAKDGNKAPFTTNNACSYTYTPSTTTASTSSVTSPYSSLSLGRGDFSNDQTAAALLNGFGGKFSPELLMEMPSMPRSGQQGQAYQQRAGFTSALVQSTEQTKPSSKTRMATAEAAQPEGKQDTVKADRRPPDPDPGPEAGPGLVLSKVTTTSQVYELPNTPRPGSSQLYPSRHRFSPDQSLNNQFGPPEHLFEMVSLVVSLGDNLYEFSTSRITPVHPPSPSPAAPLFQEPLVRLAVCQQGLPW